MTTDCSGVGGSRLRLLCDDDRSWVTVVTPDGQQFPLEFWNIVTPFFADHGLSVEWRVVRARGKPMPIAITVQLNAWQPNPNDVAAAAPAARGSEDHA